MRMKKTPTNISINQSLKNAAVAHIALGKGKPGRKARNLSDLIETLLIRHLAGKGALPAELATK